VGLQGCIAGGLAVAGIIGAVVGYGDDRQQDTEIKTIREGVDEHDVEIKALREASIRTAGAIDKIHENVGRLGA
jgi:hypothetical protein